MAVFTEVSRDQARELLHKLKLGELHDLRGIEGGIENTNFFVTAERDGQLVDYVLTVFERLSFAQLPFYLHLMKHLAQRGIPVPDPATDSAGDVVHSVAGKPAAVVGKLHGRSELAPSPAQCAAVGQMLARMHLAGRDFPRSQPNLRGLVWWNHTVPVVLPFLDRDQATLLLSELAYQNHVTAGSAYTALPRGPVHGDLFRDNVMFDDGRLTGFFDFYFAGCDTFLFDIGVCLNDWCVDLPTGTHAAEPTRAFLAGYQQVRPLTMHERQLLPALQRAAALRFWLSRLWDFHLPRAATLLKPHDPAHFERVLRGRLTQPCLM